KKAPQGRTGWCYEGKASDLQKKARLLSMYLGRQTQVLMLLPGKYKVPFDCPNQKVQTTLPIRSILSDVLRSENWPKPVKDGELSSPTGNWRILQTVLADRRCGIAAFEGTETTWTVYATKQRQPKINPENLQMPVNPGPFNSAQLFLDPFDMFLRAHLDRVQNYFGSP
ncbi:hypothetical protein OOU_Y34scaffold00567g1, partial [Pyricularia oryzae Y34]